MNKLLVVIFSSLIVVTEQSSKILNEKFHFFSFSRFIQIVQHTIHVEDMDIVEIFLMMSGLVNVNSGGMEHYVINKQTVEYK